MSQVKTIFKNISWLVISQIIASICGFIWTILIARYLGVELNGVLGFAISLTGMLSITCDFGIGTYIVRSIATDYDSTPKYLGNAIPLKSLFCIGTFILTIIILIIMKTNEITITVTLLFTIEMIIKTFIGLLNGTFQAYEKGKYQGIGNTISSLLLLTFILITIFTDFGIYGISISYILANIIALIYEYYILNKKIAKPKFEVNLEFYKKITLLSLPFAAIAFLYSIYYSIDMVMLTNMVGDYATGIYNATYKLIGVLTLFYGIYTAVIFPVMSKLFKDDKNLLIISFEKSVKYLMLIMIPLAVAITIYSKDIILLIYGQEFLPAASNLSILVWTVCLIFINGAANTLLTATHREVTSTKIYAIAAFFNIALNLIAIPKYSYNGAAITTILSDLLILILTSYIIIKLGYKPQKNLFIDLIKIILASLILGIILIFLNINMWIALPVGIIIYSITIILLKLIDNRDKFIIKEIIGKK